MAICHQFPKRVSAFSHIPISTLSLSQQMFQHQNNGGTMFHIPYAENILTDIHRISGINAKRNLKQTCFATPNIVSLEIVGEKLLKLEFFLPPSACINLWAERSGRLEHG